MCFPVNGDDCSEKMADNRVGCCFGIKGSDKLLNVGSVQDVGFHKRGLEVNMS